MHSSSETPSEATAVSICSTSSHCPNFAAPTRAAAAVSSAPRLCCKRTS
eukprot:SAG11_NODE_1549_length_4701_cov_1.707518_6_plen_49_part_00